MAKYLVFIRAERAHIAGKGADRGDVISMRPGDARVTDTERKRLLILEVEMTKAESVLYQNKIRPQSVYEPLTPSPDPKTNPDGALAWELAFTEAVEALPRFGLTVDLQATLTAQQVKDIDDFSKSVEPITANKTVLTEVQGRKL